MYAVAYDTEGEGNGPVVVRKMSCSQVVMGH